MAATTEEITKMTIDATITETGGTEKEIGTEITGTEIGRVIGIEARAATVLTHQAWAQPQEVNQ